jgi:hypothetical protein
MLHVTNVTKPTLMGSMPGVRAIATAFAAVTSASLSFAAEGGMRGALGPHSWASTSSSTIGKLILGTLRRTYTHCATKSK